MCLWMIYDLFVSLAQCHSLNDRYCCLKCCTDSNIYSWPMQTNRYNGNYTCISRFLVFPLPIKWLKPHNGVFLEALIIGACVASLPWLQPLSLPLTMLSSIENVTGNTVAKTLRSETREVWKIHPMMMSLLRCIDPGTGGLAKVLRFFYYYSILSPFFIQIKGKKHSGHLHVTYVLCSSCLCSLSF